MTDSNLEVVKEEPEESQEGEGAPESKLAIPLMNRIRRVLPDAIRRFEGQELAVFAWREQGGHQTRTRVRLKDVNPRYVTVSFTLSWQREGGEPKDVPAEFSLSSNLWLNLKVFGRKRRNWPLAESGDYERWYEGQQELTSTYPRPRGAPGVSRLGEVWYTQQPTAFSDVGISRLDPKKLPCAPVLEPYWPVYKDDGKWHVRVPAIPQDNPPQEAWGATALCFAIWSMLVILYQESPTESQGGDLDPAVYGLPSNASYLPQRPVDLLPHVIRDELQKKNLFFPWHLIEAACSSLNAGKHLLFTGPPGCGKSKLAIELARHRHRKSGTEPLVVTASPAWSTGDLIGRYFPRNDGKGLEFQPGFFLRAIDDDRWLIIDEINRADIDQCFGELFSVLAGDTVELPFKQALDDESVTPAATTAADAGALVPLSSPERRALPVRIIPIGEDRQAGAERREETGGYRDYQMSAEFRLIGTMNDADRARLHQLSYALQRRFSILRVEAPPPAEVRALIAQQQVKADEQLASHQYTFTTGTKGFGARQVQLKEVCERYLHPLFARLLAERSDPAGKKDGFSDLVAERIVGIATVLDILRFVAEGLRCPPAQGETDVLVRLPSSDTNCMHMAASYLAMGLVLNVFPQLDALPPERLKPAVEHIISVFRDKETGKDHLFLRIEPESQGEGRFQFRLVPLQASSGGLLDRDGDGRISIPEYLLSELERQFRGTAAAEWLEKLPSRLAP
ncbi:MAG TPA: AAA family ATPase [Polyangia bacterium]|nr:AAA family ATPase [Polyangia bacterium]